MKRFIFALAASALAAGAASANDVDQFELRKGAVIATDFGDRLSIAELREGLRERNIKIVRRPTARGNIYRTQVFTTDGDRYLMKVNADTGQITWLLGTDTVIVK